MSDCFSDPTVECSTLVEFLRWRAHHQPDRWAYTFLLDGETKESRLTYGELERQARAIGARLQSLGATGERALLLYPPGLEYIAAFFGCLYAGAVAVPAYPPNPARLDRTLPRLQAMIADAQATVTLTTSPILSLAGLLFDQAPELKALHWLTTDDVASDPADAWQDPGASRDTLAFLQYTSGSTAAPKGVMLTHGNLLHNSALIHRCFEHSPDSRGVIWLPPYHDMGLIGGILQPLYGGFPVILMSPVDFLQHPLRWLQAISRYRATTSGGPNFAYDLCVRKVTPEQRATLDLSGWDVAFNGAEPIHPDTLERFAATFAPCGFRREAFYPCYGLAEATLIVSGGDKAARPVVRKFQAAAEDESSRTLVGCGQTLPGQKIVIADPESSTSCPPDQAGEIWVSGPGVAQGYWNRPEETAHTFRAYLADTGEGPFLRTGDLGFLKNGELFIAGRLKDLIIIRGRNHYPQDIELTVEQSHPALRPGCGAAFSVDVAGEERLVVVQEVRRTHRSTDIDEAARAVRQAVAEEHELQVYAVVLLEPGGIAKTSSGKIQRHACRVQFLTGSLSVVSSSILEDSCTAPSDESLTREALLAVEPKERLPLLASYLEGQAAQVLRVASSQIDPQQPLVTLGIDSLMAVELQHRIEAGLGVGMPAVSLLEGVSVAQLAAQVLDQLTPMASAPSAPLILAPQMAENAQPPPIQPVSRDGNLPLSFDQERLWLLDHLAPGNPAYNIPLAVRLMGRLNVDALAWSLNEVVSRHEALRTTFPTVDGRPGQVIAPALRLTLPAVDLRDLPETERERVAQRLITEKAQRPFDLARGPLIRAALLRLGEEEHVAIWTTHHIISDVWSMVVLLKEVTALYSAFSTGESASLAGLPFQYADFACWQRQWLQDERLAEPLAYWKERLADAPPAPMLPTDRPRPEVQSFRGAYRSFELSPGLSESLRRLSRREGVTLFMTLLAAFKTLLHRYSGQEDIVVGSPVSGRLHPESERLIGFFAYPVVLRTDLSGDPTFRELLARVREVALGAYAHQAVPFARVVEVAHPRRTAQYHPLFQVMFGFLDKPMSSQELPDLMLEPLDVGKGMTDLDLFLTMLRGEEGLHGVLEYNTDLLEADTIERFIGAYCGLLEQCVRHPEKRLAQFEAPEKLDARARVARAGERKRSIAIAATFTAEPIQETLVFWMQELGMPFRVAFAPYNQVFQQLLKPSSLLAKNQDGVNVILVRFEDWQGHSDGAGAEAGSLPDTREKIERNVRDLVLAVKSAAERSATPHLVCVCPASPAALADANRAALLKRMEEWMVSGLDDTTGVYLVTTSELAALYPVARYYDPYTDEQGHIPYTPAFFTALGTLIARRVYVIQNPPYKVIVLDCDQTLWKGVCGEDGALGVELDPPRRALQEFMVAQHDAGMLLCLCSKNAQEDVWEVFARRPEMPLKRQHIVAWRINWQPKSDNIRSLAEELELGLDSFVFLDDSPVECAEVQANCPEVLTLQLPQEPSRIPRFLRHVWAFDHLKVTEADRERTLLYRQNAERKRFEETSLTFDEFLAGLELVVQISALSPQHLPRVAQLTQRTNQFNLTTIRRSESEIHNLCLTGDLECLVVEVRDRFGDYGLVGAVIFKADSAAIKVDTFLLSCRALGRGVERRMLARLGEIAVERGLERVDVSYIPTRKNQPARDFLERVGTAFKQPDGDGFLFRLPAQLAATLTCDSRAVEPSNAGNVSGKRAVSALASGVQGE